MYILSLFNLNVQCLGVIRSRISSIQSCIDTIMCTLWILDRWERNILRHPEVAQQKLNVPYPANKLCFRIERRAPWSNAFLWSVDIRTSLLIRVRLVTLLWPVPGADSHFSLRLIFKISDVSHYCNTIVSRCTH